MQQLFRTIITHEDLFNRLTFLITFLENKKFIIYHFYLIQILTKAFDYIGYKGLTLYSFD